MAPDRTSRDNARVTRCRVTAQQRWQVFGPRAKLAGRDALRVVCRVVEDAEHLVREEFSDGTGHAGEALHKEVDWRFAVEVERRAAPLRGVRPRVIVVQPAVDVNIAIPHAADIDTHMLISTMPSDQTSAARGL